ncbi:MAG: hypothetical protein LBP63_10015 [Prevotellaceae bacterium]|jgi:hypothetical protein|nr:hypothetical protein [Prevotellaceae bacterium]
MRKDCWVSPEGKITWCEKFAKHEDLAYQIMNDNGYYEEFITWYIQKLKQKIIVLGTDYLIEEKGYIKYMDWGHYPDWVGFDHVDEITDEQAKVILNFEELYKHKKQELENNKQ